jgi:hypothetical protein
MRDNTINSFLIRKMISIKSYWPIKREKFNNRNELYDRAFIENNKEKYENVK